MNESILELKRKNTPFELARIFQTMPDIFWSEKEKIWIVTEYHLAKEVLTSEQFTADRGPFFIERMPNVDINLLSRFFPTVKEMMVMADGKEHKKKRGLCLHGFTNHNIKKLTDKILKITDGLLSQVGEDHPFDFCELFSKPLPIQLLGDFFELPEEDRKQMTDAAKTMTAFFGGRAEYTNATAIETNLAAEFLTDYFTEQLKKAKQVSDDGFWAQLVLSQQQAQISDEQVVAQVAMMWVAGMVTTYDQLNNNLYTLLDKQSNYCSQPESLSQAEQIVLIQECNRLDPAVSFTFRLANEDIELGGVHLKKNEAVFIANHAVNYQADIFSTPESIMLDRKSKHLGHGYGPHYCLGARLSLVMMQCVFEKLFTKFNSLYLLSAERDHYSRAFSGLKSLWVVG